MKLQGIARYRASGRFQPVALIYCTAAMVLAVPVAWFYQLAIRWLPIIELAVVPLVAIALLMGFTVPWIVEKAHIRNRFAGGLLGLLLGTGALATTHYWEYTRGIDKLMEANPLFSREDIVAQVPFSSWLEMRVKTGWRIKRFAWGGAGFDADSAQNTHFYKDPRPTKGSPDYGWTVSTEKGFMVWLIWAFEAAVFIGVGFVMGCSSAGMPYCEECHRWTEERVTHVPGMSSDKFLSLLNADSLHTVAAPGAPAHTSNEQWLTLSLYKCLGCQRSWLSVKRIGGIEAMLRVRAGAEVPRRSADRRRPSSAPSGWTGRAAPWSTRRPWPPSHEVRSRSLALLTLAA